MRYFLILGTTAAAALPCEIPVFRYALEHWPAEAYVLVLPARIPPGEETRMAEIARWVRAGANLEIRRVGEEGGRSELRYPESTGIRRTLWEGDLRELPTEPLFDSPARRLLVEKVRQGAAAVWIFIECGDRTRDEAAAAVLEARLREAADVPDSTGRRPVFPVIRVSPEDPEERWLVRMLMRSEEGLESSPGPWVFPVFGRGRKLEALAGPGISMENIAEYVAFLTGPCSCRVKLQNPGIDLLLTADWGTLGTERTPEAAAFLEVLPVPSRRGPGLWGWAGLLLVAAGVAAMGGVLLSRGCRPR